MRASELTENRHDRALVELPTMLAQIKKDCQPFLSMIGNDLGSYQLYRGIKNTHDAFIYNKEVRLNGRKPRDTNRKSHDLINRVMSDMYGEPFRDSVFCSGNKLGTFSYGPTFFIFPIGEFSYCWSPTIKDMANTAFAMYTNTTIIKRELDAANYMTTGFTSAIRSKHEIMIRCNSYHAIACPHSDEDVNNILGLMIKGLR